MRAFKANCVYARALMFSFLCFSAASFSCVCVFSRLFQSAIPLVRTQTLFLLSNANPPLHFAFLQCSPSLYSEAPSLYSHSYAGAHTHTQPHMHSLLFTSDVVLSVFPSVDHLVVVIEEVLCNAAIGPISGTKK